MDKHCEECEKLLVPTKYERGHPSHFLKRRFCNRSCHISNLNRKLKPHQASWNKGLTKETSEVLRLTGKKISEVKTGKKYPNISKALIGISRNAGENNPFYDKHHTQETKQKMSLARRGENNVNWKGGLTKLVRGIRRSPEYHQWRKAVLERDKHTCQDCGCIRRIVAHHKQSIFDYPKGVFEVDNGLALCSDCHKRHTSWQRLNGG